MKRKKFVKRLMAKGCPRNKAVRIAYFFVRHNLPYCEFEPVRFTKLESGKHYCEAIVSDRVKKEIKTVYVNPVKLPSMQEMGLPSENGEDRNWCLEPSVNTERVKLGMSTAQKAWWLNSRPGYQDTVPITGQKNAGYFESEQYRWLQEGPLAPPLPKAWQNLIDASRYAASVCKTD